ncbi:hypothetical protein SAMD00019534_021630 [Acytostelium subglobosum LB1]|uniref:hypothetical protein n=1 Tax=Acytostelium subglobosum LB1 TaxID=1410327 RepID=UPI0006449462|nr:hypothetical protein SAMD00019534_021630 [Acytostelium subglobosum LB1]GAM18988.1 hypothetical protein SAMD00019534_021630 [Acytostelium subglobosum LB1]|eukprot:XP_012756915.1 hypothetical protein SAMD00019534_021630 [Acytostelium subglobosum LB1]
MIPMLQHTLSSTSTTSSVNGVTSTSIQTNTLASSQSSPVTNCIRVVCRFRPITEPEVKRNEHSIIQFLDNQSFVIKQQSNSTPQQYTFDRTFNTDEDQSVVFHDVAIPIVQDFLDGYNGTILAYGQTASGKTYTIYGEPSKDDTQQDNNGIIPRIIEEIFTGIARMRQKNNELAFVLKMSCVELYMEKINDLYNVSGTNLPIREHPDKGIYVEGVCEKVIQCPDDAFSFLNLANNNRAVAATKMSQASSRSHSILMIELSQQNLLDLSSKKSKLFLVDLAGSERASKTGAEGERMQEAKTINLSLTNLGTVINSLTNSNKTHVPYRNSKLTRVLQESLGGNSKTTLIIACSPSNGNESETVSTIQFGLRAKNITNKPKINKEVTVIELKQLLEKANIRIKELDELVELLNSQLESQKQDIETLEREKQDALLNSSVSQQQDGPSLTCNKKVKREILPHVAPTVTAVRRLKRVFKPNPPPMSVNDLESPRPTTDDEDRSSDRAPREVESDDDHSSLSRSSSNSSNLHRQLDEKDDQAMESQLVPDHTVTAPDHITHVLDSMRNEAKEDTTPKKIPLNTTESDEPTPPISPRSLPLHSPPSLSNSITNLNLLPMLSTTETQSLVPIMNDSSLDNIDTQQQQQQQYHHDHLVESYDYQSVNSNFIQEIEEQPQAPPRSPIFKRTKATEIKAVTPPPPIDTRPSTPPSSPAPIHTQDSTRQTKPQQQQQQQQTTRGVSNNNILILSAFKNIYPSLGLPPRTNICSILAILQTFARRTKHRYLNSKDKHNT